MITIEWAGGELQEAGTPEKHFFAQATHQRILSRQYDDFVSTRGYWNRDSNTATNVTF
tara:strand:- start:73 stop:246 length:174 start_codon:yes stop_codon:yes gene_type:complete